LCLKCKRFSVVKLLFYIYDSLISYSLKGKMKNHRLLMLVGAVIATLTSGWLPVLAADLNYNGAFLYKDAKDNIYLISNSENTFTYDNVAISKASYSDTCGFISLRFSNADIAFPSAISFNSTSSSLASIPIVTEKNPYKCVNGVAKWNGTPQTSIFQTSVNDASGNFQIKNIYYPSSVTGGASKQGMISYTSSVIKNVKPNACGFIVTPGYANSQKKTSATVRRDGTPINVATLPVNPNPPDCVGGKTLVGSSTAVATFNGASLYRTTKNIYFAGLVPRSLNVVEYDALAGKSYTPTDKSCGLFAVQYKKAIDIPVTMKIGATSYTTATIVGQNNPVTCSSAMVNTLYRYGSYFLYKTTDPTQKQLVIETPKISTINMPVNACGFTVIPSLNTANGFTTGDKVTINGSTPYNVMTLPLAPTGPTCKNGVVYLSTP
jgi:hypothetical protein